MNQILKYLIRFQHNIVHACIFAFVMFTGEEIFRYLHPLLAININLHDISIYLLIGLIASFFKSKNFIRGIYLFVLFFTLIQYIHFNFYGTWTFPVEYMLFFTKLRETMETFFTVLHITIVPLLLIIVSFFLLWKSVNKMSEDRITIPYLSVVLILFLIFIPARVFFKEHSKKGARPNIEVIPIVNTMETLGYLFGRIIPKKISGKSGLEQKVVSAPKVIQKDPKINIVVVMGESLTVAPMSLYGEKEITTPNLDKMKTDKNFLYQIAFSSGVMTDISLPSFFNILYQPDSISQIVSTNTCLFKLAKLNGFTTHFYSAQSRDGLSNIKSYLCMKWIDHLSDASEFTKNIKVDTLDNILVEKLKKIDLSIPNFIVLHQIGSHTPVRTRYPKEFEHFKPNHKDIVDLSGYKNTILYTDYILTQLIKVLKEKSKLPTYFFFTSDHGEGIDEHAGHGHLNDKNQYQVPFIMYVINPKREIQYTLKDKKYTSHFEIAKLIARTLGYDTSNLRKFNGEHVVCGSDLTGIAGILKIKTEKDKIVKLKVSN